MFDGDQTLSNMTSNIFLRKLQFYDGHKLTQQKLDAFGPALVAQIHTDYTFLSFLFAEEDKASNVPMRGILFIGFVFSSLNTRLFIR